MLIWPEAIIPQNKHRSSIAEVRVHDPSLELIVLALRHCLGWQAHEGEGHRLPPSCQQLSDDLPPLADEALVLSKTALDQVLTAVLERVWSYSRGDGRDRGYGCDTAFYLPRILP
jgi:hypothetical protein